MIRTCSKYTAYSLRCQIINGVITAMQAFGFLPYLRSMGEMSLGDAMREYLRHSPFRNKMNEVRIQNIWEKEMGQTIAKYTRSIRLVNRQLIISTDVAPLKQELSYSKETIVQRMNEALGESLIDKVIIK